MAGACLQTARHRTPLTEHRSAVQKFAPRPEIHRALEENAPADIEQSVAAPGMLCSASMEVSAAELVGGKPVWRFALGLLRRRRDAGAGHEHHLPGAFLFL